MDDVSIHGDIRETLEIIPKVITGVAVSGPGTVKTGVVNTFTVQAVPLLPDSYINRVEVELPDGQVLVKSGVNIVNNSVSFDFSVTGEDMASVDIKVRVFDNFGSKSETHTHPIVISTNNAPNLSNLNISGLPAYLASGVEYSLSFTGGVDADGDPISYAIGDITNATNVVFSKTTGIADGESFTVTLTALAPRNTEFQFTVTGSDARFGGTASKVFTFTSNTKPEVVGMNLVGLPATIKPNTTYPVSISGATDIDTQTLTYAISTNADGVTFSKAAGLTEGESFNIIVGGIERGTTPEFILAVSDSCETSTKSYTGSLVNSLPLADSIVADGLPANVFGGAAQTFTLSGGSDVDGQALTYKIVGGAGLNLSPTLGIVADSNVSFNATKVANVTTIEFTVYAVDSIGEQSASGKVFSVTVDPILKTSTPSIISPNAGATVNLPYTFQVSPYTTYTEL